MASFETIADDFAFLDDWDERYKYLIDLGRQLPELADHERSEETKVRGCASQVWLVFDEITQNNISFRGDSDAHIVKGLVALMIALFSGKSAREVIALDAEEALAKIDLKDHITPQRSNGVAAMMTKIKTIAAEAV